MRNLRPEPDSRISKPTGAIRICRRWPPVLRYFRYEKGLSLQDCFISASGGGRERRERLPRTFGYDLYGSPFSRGDEYVQALVKSEDVPATDVPSTLRPAVKANLDQPN